MIFAFAFSSDFLKLTPNSCCHLAVQSVGFDIIDSIRDRSGQFNTHRLYISLACNCASLTNILIWFLAFHGISSVQYLSVNAIS